MVRHYFDLRHEENGTTSVVRIAGELDIGAVPHLRTLVGELMGAGVREVTVDLQHTAFVDSSGLGALLWAEYRLRALGGHLEVVHPQDHVQRAIALAGLDGVLLN